MHLAEDHVRTTTFPSELWKNIFGITWPCYICKLLKKPQDLTVLEGGVYVFNLEAVCFHPVVWEIYEMLSANEEHLCMIRAFRGQLTPCVRKMLGTYISSK